MSDRWSAPGHQIVTIPRRRVGGLDVWRVRLRDGKAHRCEVRDDRRYGEGWDVMLLIDDEPMFSHRCEDKAEADYGASALESDALKRA